MQFLRKQNFEEPNFHDDKTVRQVKNMANPELTKPSIGFVPHSKGKVDGN